LGGVGAIQAPETAKARFQGGHEHRDRNSLKGDEVEDEDEDENEDDCGG